MKDKFWINRDQVANNCETISKDLEVSQSYQIAYEEIQAEK